MINPVDYRICGVLQ